ncbi:MAG: hypothetical protein M1812_004249 [Candelaria pacifica]|nr:MAG: hypothetical protein M1812_004249 [Candelaria pacifica]
MALKLVGIVSLLLFGSFSVAEPFGLKSSGRASPRALDLIEARDQPADYRRLTAVTRRSSIQSRSGCFRPKHDHELHYVDEETLGTSSPFAAQMKVKSKYPTLALEDIDPHVEGIQCSKTTVTLSFGSRPMLEAAKAAWSEHTEFLIISSHVGCNEDGERTPYVVSRVHFIEASSTAELSIIPIAWQDTFHAMTVDFGSSANDYTFDALRRHDTLHRRQAASLLLKMATSTTSGVTFSRAYPTAPATATPAMSVNGSLTSQVIGKQIYPPDVPFADEVVPPGITVSCKNCSVGGGLQLSQGSFSMSQTNGTSNSSQNFMQFFTSGYVQVITQNLTAHVDLNTIAEPTITLQNFTAHLPTIPLTPFQIPGIAVVGPSIDPQIIGSIKLGSKLDFTYGFDLSIPDGSSVTLDIGSITNTTTQGFERSKITPLPFQASTGEVALNFSIGFRPELLLGINLLQGRGKAGAGVFFDLPKLVVEVSQVTSSDKNCTPIKTTSNTIQGTLANSFGNLTHIVPSVELAVGVELEAAFQQGNFKQDIETDYTAYATTFTLPTACLSYDKAKSSFGAAVQNLQTTATGTAGVTKPSNGVGSKGSPILYEGAAPGEKRFLGCLVAMLGVSMGFAWL